MCTYYYDVLAKRRPSNGTTYLPIYSSSPWRWHAAVILAFKSGCGGGLDDMVVVLSLLLLVVLLKSEISFALRRLRAVIN